MDKKNCDVVVIGAGIGGLCLAARLAFAGYKTIVLEKMPLLGGRYTFVDYKGYWVPVSAICIWAGWKDPVLLTIKELKANTDFEKDMKVLPQPKWRVNGKDYEMPAKGSLTRLMSLASKDKQEEEKINKAFSRALRWREPSGDITFWDWLLKLTDNKTILNIYQALCVQVVGPNAWEISAGEAFKYLRSYVGMDMLVPRKGLKPLVDSLAKVITDNKGEILESVKVNKIIVKNGSAVGVEATGNEGRIQIETKVVVSNVGPKKTVELAGENNFDDGYLKEVKALKPWSGLSYIVASDGPLYNWPGGVYTIDTRRVGGWCDFTLIWPEWAPQGKNWMYFYQGTESAYSYDPKKEYDAFMADLADTFPRYKEQNAEVLLVHHYTSDWPCLRAWPTAENHRRTAVENLYNVGDAVGPQGWSGGSAAAESARIVAKDIMARIKH